MPRDPAPTHHILNLWAEGKTESQIRKAVLRPSGQQYSYSYARSVITTARAKGDPRAKRRADQKHQQQQDQGVGG